MTQRSAAVGLVDMFAQCDSEAELRAMVSQAITLVLEYQFTPQETNSFVDLVCAGCTARARMLPLQHPVHAAPALFRDAAIQAGAYRP